MSKSQAPAQEPSEIPSQRELIRSHMKMVIDQLEGILIELKDVARELREVVGQIDKLTADFDFDPDPDEWTVATASSTSSSERGLSEAFRLDFLSHDALTDAWDFCGYRKMARDEDDLEDEEPGSSASVTPTPTVNAYSQMNGGLPIPNGPLMVTPDSSSEEASSSTHSQKTSRTSGTRERVRFSDKVLYHALCCDDDDDDEPEEEEEEGVEEEDKVDCGMPDTDSEPSPLASSPIPPLSSSSECSSSIHKWRETSSAGPSPVKVAVLGPHTLPRKGPLKLGGRKKLLRNSSTQTVSDKSTQTLLPYVPGKQKNKEH